MNGKELSRVKGNLLMMKIFIAGKAFEATGSSGHHETGDSMLGTLQES